MFWKHRGSTESLLQTNDDGGGLRTFTPEVAYFSYICLNKNTGRRKQVICRGQNTDVSVVGKVIKWNFVKLRTYIHD